MTRTLFFATCAAAVVFAATAVMIRVELASPGVSALFLDENGAPDGSKFNDVAILHGLFGDLSVILLGTTMCAAARDKGAMFAGLFAAAGTICAIGVCATFVLANWPQDATPVGEGVGWVLYPPLSHGPTPLDRLLSLLNLPPVSFIDFPRLLLLPAAVMIHVGAFAMVSTHPRLRWIGGIGAVLCIAVAAMTVPGYLNSSLMELSQILIAMTLLVLLACAIQLYEQRPVWLILLSLGATLPVIGLFLARQVPSGPYFSDTMSAAAMLYVYPLGLAWVAAAALIAFTHPSRLPTAAAVAIPFAIWVAIAPWTGAMFQLGRIGMPMRYVDYPNAFADLNGFTTRAVFAFGATYLGALTLIKKTRA